MGKVTASEKETGGGQDAAHPIELGPVAPARPRRDDFRPFGKWVPWLVPVFVVANFVVFGVTMYVNNCPTHSDHCVARFLGRFSFEPLKKNSLLGPSEITLKKMGILDREKVVNKHQAWRLITCIWLHVGVVHVLANMLALLLIGLRLEQEFGFVRIGLLYMIAGFGGSVLSALLSQSNSAGASGALFGLLGAMLSELITNWTLYSNKFAALLTLLFTIAINLAIGFLPHVDNAAHIGGFVSGFLLGFIIMVRPQFAWVNQRNAPLGYHTGSVKQKYKLYQSILWIVAAILLIAGFVVGLLMLFQGFNLKERCSWCRYLSCIPTSISSCEPQVIRCSISESHKRIYLNITCEANGKTQALQPNADADLIQELCQELCS